MLLFITATLIREPSHVSPIVPQSRLQECLRERAELLQVQERTRKEREEEKEEYKRAREAWDRRHKGLERDITRLREDLKQSLEKIEEMERKQEVLKQMMGQIIWERFARYHFHIFLCGLFS